MALLRMKSYGPTVYYQIQVAFEGTQQQYGSSLDLCVTMLGIFREADDRYSVSLQQLVPDSAARSMRPPTSALRVMAIYFYQRVTLACQR